MNKGRNICSGGSWLTVEWRGAEAQIPQSPKHDVCMGLQSAPCALAWGTGQVVQTTSLQNLPPNSICWNGLHPTLSRLLQPKPSWLKIRVLVVGPVSQVQERRSSLEVSAQHFCDSVPPPSREGRAQEVLPKSCSTNREWFLAMAFFHDYGQLCFQREVNKYINM